MLCFHVWETEKKNHLSKNARLHLKEDKTSYNIATGACLPKH